jgi:arabinosaccharide transport system substrate-binding protein
MIEKFPYGKAPFWLLVTAIVSTLLLLAVRGERPPRPDLILVTFTGAHKEAYERAIPRFEREHGVKVQVQLANWRSLRSRLQNAVLAGTEVPDLVEMFEGSLGFFTRGPREDIGFVDLTDRIKHEGWYDRMVASRFSLWSARGRIYGLPHDVHPVMLAYRRDLVEKLGIDVNELDTWNKFVAVGQRITRDLDGDGVIDRYMIDLPISGGHGITTLLLQRGGHLFDPAGEVAFNSPEVAEVFLWYLRQTRGPKRIAYDCGWGQSFMKAVTDGLALFYLTPDWRSYGYQDGIPRLAGKMALMPLPAWQPGGRRTSVWGGTGLLITKATKDPDLAWALAKFLYFNPKELGRYFSGTNIIPPLKDAWALPEFDRPSPFYSGQPVGRLYANLAPQTPPVYSAPVDSVARKKVDEAYSRTVEYYKQHGERGIAERIRAELDQAEAYVRRIANRNQILLAKD